MENTSIVAAVLTLIENGHIDAAHTLLGMQAAESTPNVNVDAYRQPAQHAGKLVRQVRTASTPASTQREPAARRYMRPTVGYHVTDKRVRVDADMAFGGSQNHRAVWADVVKHPGATMREIAARTKLVPKAVESSLHFLRTHRADGGECKYTVRAGRKSYSQTGLIVSRALDE